MNDRLIEVEDLKKTYTMGPTSIEVLKGVSFAVGRGEFVMIVGPSGSGKSTLLHLLAGLDQPTSGKVKVLDQDLSQASDRNLSRLRNHSIGFVFQFYHLFPELNAYENVVLPHLISRTREGAKGVEELFKIIGLENRKLHRPQELSGGEQQRLAIARALVNGPRILLADEPTGNLDIASGNAVLELLEQLHRMKGLSIVMATHNPDFLRRAQRVLSLRDGKIVE